MKKLIRVAGLCVILASAQSATASGEWRGNVSTDGWWFFHDARDADQQEGSVSIAFEPEYFTDWDEGDQRLVLAPFFRWDPLADERTHGDIRELYWQKGFSSAELVVGIKKIFWGVTESQHLVDIINQTDLLENIDAEDKLGQPMVQLSILKGRGTLDFFLLPYFRERTFPGAGGRPRTPLPVDPNTAVFESGAGEHHVDYAIRWSHYIGDWDLGLAHFSGTGREPRLVPGMDGRGEPVLIPHYDQIDQFSLDLQITKGSWLIKLEALTRDTSLGRKNAATGGFEYTFVGLGDSALDLGLLVEYSYDNNDIPGLATLFDNDVFLGTRLAFNDVQGAELLIGGSFDLEHRSRFFSIEGSRRLGQTWKVGLELRIFNSREILDPLFAVRDDDYTRLVLSRYF